MPGCFHVVERAEAAHRRHREATWKATADRRANALMERMAAFDAREASREEFIKLWSDNGGGWAIRAQG